MKTFVGRTNIELDDNLLKKALKLTGAKTKKEVVHHALKELVRRESRKEILKLEGKIKWKGNLSQMRKDRFDSR